MPLKIYKRPSGIYHIRGTFKGRRVDRSAGTRSREVADSERQQIEADILDEDSGRSKSNRTFAEAALAYMKAGGERRFLAPIIEHFAMTRLRDMTGADAQDAAIKLYPNAAPATVNRQLFTPIRAVLGYAEEQGWLVSVPRIRRRKAPKGRTRWLRIWEVSRIMRHAGRYAPMVAFGMETGCRAAEIIRLDWRDVDLDGRRAHLWAADTKASKYRPLTFGARTEGLLRPFRAQSGPVFTRSDGKPYSLPEGRSAGTVLQGPFRRISEASGVEFTPHVLRHTWATWSYAWHLDALRLKQEGGWSSLDQVEIYAHLAPPRYGDKLRRTTWEPSGR